MKKQIENLLRFFLNLKLLWIKFCNKQIMCIMYNGEHIKENAYYF